MAMCNLCGSEAEILFQTRIEGAEMIVCENCSKLGKVIKEIIPEKQEIDDYEDDTIIDESDNIIEVVVSNYGRLVKQAREKKGLKQEELAKILALKESLFHNIESGHFEPNIELARKLEKSLHITLIQKIKEKKVQLKHEDSAPMTLGDMIKSKMKK